MSKRIRSKIQLSLSHFGIIIGAVGILHGVFELLQGTKLVESNTVAALPENWPNAELFALLDGQPVFSIFTGIPFYLLGSMAIVVSSALIIHSWRFIEKKNGLLYFVLLNVGIYLFGAGIGTPFALGVPLVVFTLISRRFNQKKERSEAANQLNLRLFWIFYGLQVFSWILFFPGLFIISSFGKIPQALFMFDFGIMPVSILGALIFGLRYDNTIHTQN